MHRHGKRVGSKQMPPTTCATQNTRVVPNTYSLRLAPLNASHRARTERPKTHTPSAQPRPPLFNRPSISQSAHLVLPAFLSEAELPVSSLLAALHIAADVASRDEKEEGSQREARGRSGGAEETK